MSLKLMHSLSICNISSIPNLKVNFDIYNWRGFNFVCLFMHFELEWVLEISDTELRTSNSLFSLHRHRWYYKEIAERCWIVFALYCDLSYTGALKREVKPKNGRKGLLDDFLRWWAFVLILSLWHYWEISQRVFVMFTFYFFSVI